MQTDFLPLDLYTTHLKTINGISFTRREIEIIAFLVSGRGVKTTAFSLSIAPKTVATHVHNIMLKLECNSRESIINFIEKSDKFSLLRRHYSDILTSLSFDQSLVEIAKLNVGKHPSCLVISWEENGKLPLFIHQLETHLQKAGFKISVENRKNPQSTEELFSESTPHGAVIYFLPKLLSPSLAQMSLCPANILFLLPDQESKEGAFQKIPLDNFMNLSRQENYYSMFFQLLKKLLPDINLDSIIRAFTGQCDISQFSTESPSTQAFSGKNDLKEEKTAFTAQSKSKLNGKKWPLISAFLFIGICGVSFFVNKQFNPSKYQWTQKENPSIRSDLVLPMEEAFLNRSELLAQIDDAFKGQNRIQTVALVGIGGSGKTTLARQYAHQQKTPLIWEINVETQNSFLESFEHLAYALSKTEEDKRVLRGLQEIKTCLAREKKIVEFVKERLRLYANWFLIYDNVEKFTDIQKYFPLDAETWGQGKVILTTRDNNIQNNKHVNHTIQIGELDENQKLHLLTKIMSQGTKNSFDAAQIKEAKKFLREIPPFPLDVSVASYYIKTTNVSYDQYLEGLKSQNTDLTSVQEGILKESGEYTKTRYNIVTLSLQQLIKSHKDFTDLLLFISLLDSQNIPKELLNHYKNSSLVDNFIYHLKKHSLITTQSSLSSGGSTLSIHRSTQAIILAYLTKLLNLKAQNTVIQTVANTLEKYVEEALDKEDLPKAKQVISHLEMFLSHDYLLTDSPKGLIESELGYIYSSLSLFIQANHFFEKAVLKLRKDENQNYEKIAQNLLFQGYSCNILGSYKKAENLLEESIRAYKQHIPNNSARLALGMVYLGNVYRWTGEYEKAKDLFQQSLVLYEKLPPQTCPGKTMALAYLGDVYRRVGDYKKAIEATEESLRFCRQYLPKNNVRQAWPLVNLGIIHKNIGNYERAIDLINKSNVVYEKNFSRNSIFFSANLVELAKAYCDLGDFKQAINLVDEAILIYKKINLSFDVCRTDGLGCIGNAYKGLGNYEKAKEYLERNLVFFEKHYGKKKIETAHLLESLGQVYLLEGNSIIAEEFLSRALDIFQKNNHPSVYKCLESFSDLHLKKSDEAANKAAMEEASNFKIQAINDLKKALEIIKTHFPEDSPHKVRIESKLKKLEKI